MRHLLVKGGVIVNVIEYDPELPYDPPADHRLIPHAHDAPHEIGWAWDGYKAIDPDPKPEPGPLGRPIVTIPKMVRLNVVG